MSYRVCLVVVAGCASAGAPHEGIELVDSGVTIDGPSVTTDAPIQCTPTTTQLLVNGNFDSTPDGMGWTTAPIDPTLPIVTPDDGVVEQSAPNKAWMGGIAQAGATDEMFQDIAIPANTTDLAVTGFYDVRTAETGTAVKDTAKVVLAMTNNTVIDTVLATDNTLKKTAWTPLDHTFANAAALSGQTVRLRFTTSNNATANTETSFYFDTLALTATHCQ